MVEMCLSRFPLNAHITKKKHVATSPVFFANLFIIYDLSVESELPEETKYSILP